MTQLDLRPETTPRGRSAATREVAVFLGTTFSLLALSTTVGLAEGVDVRHIEDASALGQLSMYGQALFPTIGALAARAVTPRERRTPFGFRRPPARTLAIAWAVGLVPTVVAGALVWALGLAGFDAGGLGPVTVLGCTVLGLPYVLLALGEDLGWRGLMATRLAEVAGPRAVVLLTGLAWGMFHWPLMLFLGGTPAHTPLWFALASFTIGTAALGAVLASMQLRWGIWPGLVVHAMVNAGLYHVVGPLTTDTAHSGWFAGEVGLVQNLVLVAMAVAWWRFAPLRRTPDGRTVAG